MTKPSRKTAINEVDNSPSKAHHGSVLSFHNITYTVDVDESCCGSCRKKSKKHVLIDVSGMIKPGLNAIMGPTGSGKSSLLDVLSNRKDPDWLTGCVLLDGQSLPKNYKYISGYVIQNDLMIGTLTVRETLWFCANLRLPTSISHEEKKDRIETTITQLGLERCADTKVGTQIIRGISGGEKKRTSIALELILEPRILFLDEPTTGLDASTASSVMVLLKKLGNQGHTIVCSIHQPRYSIYKLFDTLTLLSAGELVYHGNSAEALPFFETQGYTCEEHDNPADFFLDLLNGEYEQQTDDSTSIMGEVKSLVDKDFVVDVEVDITKKLATSYRNSVMFKSTEEELTVLSKSATERVKVKRGQLYATSFLHQLKVLLGRTAKNTIRNPQALIGNAVINVIIGIVFGLIYFQVDNTPDTGIQNRLGIIFFICTNLLFGSTSVIEIFNMEKEIFIHEYVSGYYRVVSYFLAKVLADLIPLRTVAPIIFCSITYWMVGLKSDPGSFFTFLLIAVLVGYASVGIGLFYSSSFQNAVAQLFLILTFVFTIMFSGLLVNVDTIMPWLSWLKYLSVARFGLAGLSLNELRGQNFTSCVTNGSTLDGSSVFGTIADAVITRPDNNTVCLTIKGEQYLHTALSIGSSADDINGWDLWQNPVALGCICLVVYSLTYMQLFRTKTFS